ncbi:ChbG/HpnK family deacetylase [Ruania zhangjianzhongii]|uniref:ChbG/HpnK family deacetylase n=1 Tax=Ruania zhangjianzhongii TaxID=2603206 RepID=UPI001AEFE1A5|nr:ChbG/HpnK family deacetylase [Ruania zhangjianzhongii]
MADDVGQSAAIDDGVAALARAGHLSAASVLVRAPGALAALAALDGVVPLGVHVQLEPAELAGASSAQITALITEQVEAMITAGYSPAHLDLHTAALYGLAEGERRTGERRTGGRHTGERRTGARRTGGRCTGAAREGGVLAEAIAVAAAYRLRFRLPRRAPVGLSGAHLAAHARAVAAAQAAGVELPDVLITEMPDAAAVPAFLAELSNLLASGPDGPTTAPLRTGPQPQGLRGEVELVTHPALRADPGDPLGPERVRQHALLASGALHPR